MSSYKNFVSDFPARCAALLGDFERTARLRRREVTLMLCVAMPSIVVPLERLSGPRSTPKGEPGASVSGLGEFRSGEVQSRPPVREAFPRFAALAKYFIKLVVL